MKLALLPPPRNSEYMLRTDYQLLLPSHFDKGNYSAVVHQCSERGDFTILDNGIAEGHAITEEGELYDLAKEYEVSEVVIPDVYGNTEGTLHLLKGWRFDEEYQHMAVLAAQTPDEVRKLIDAYWDQPLIDTIGVPRLLWDHNISRGWVAGLLHELWAENRIEIHLLGMNSSAMYEMFSWPIEGVRGVDTSSPFVYGLRSWNWKRKDWVHVAHRQDGYDEVNIHGTGNYVSECVDDNVEFLQGRVNGTSTPVSEV